MILCRQEEDAGEERGEWGKSLTSQGRKTPREVYPHKLSELMIWKPRELSSACHSSPSHPSTGLSQSGAPRVAQKHTVVLRRPPLQVPSPNCDGHFTCPLSSSHCHAPRCPLPFDTPWLRGWHISIHTPCAAPPPCARCTKQRLCSHLEDLGPSPQSPRP